uniref:Uncharacterized protein n=1 Tax=Klebsiella pneumoniae TaxID=573 RepID=A0A8B0SV14_KLEPN|nr:hypothetical protein [Klebsiella pneumoniae]
MFRHNQDMIGQFINFMFDTFFACEKSITIDSAFRSPSRIISTIRLSPISPASASRKLKSMTVRSLIKKVSPLPL